MDGPRMWKTTKVMSPFFAASINPILRNASSVGDSKSIRSAVSAKAFCQGEAGAMGLSRIPKTCVHRKSDSAILVMKTAEDRSRSSHDRSSRTLDEACYRL